MYRFIVIVSVDTCTVLQHTENAFNVYRVELSSGEIGYGENLYDESGNIERLVGQNPFACMNDDGVGFGIQMALYDAVGKSVGCICI